MYRSYLPEKYVEGKKRVIMIIIAKQDKQQLGNKLNLFANFIALAIENDFPVMNVAFYEYADFFEATNKDLFCRYPPKSSFFVNNSMRNILHLIIYYITRFIHFLKRLKIENKRFKIIKAFRDKEEVNLDTPEFVDLVNQSKIVFVQGYFFRGPSLFIKHADKIRDYFTPLEKYRNNVSNLISHIRKSSQVIVGVHIRHGDYKEHLKGKYFYDIDKYIQMMEKVRKLFMEQEVAFLICSNSEQDKNKFAKFSFTFGTNHIIEDMYSLAQCDYIIGPPSSYSMWAAFYGRVPLYAIEDPDADISFDSFRIYQTLEWVL